MGVVVAVTTLRVSEVFGPTVQGEGPHTGRVVGFLRLGLCNLSCTWCDTPYTWDRTRYDLDVEAPPVDVSDVADRVAALGLDTIVLTGGEPLVQQRAVADLFALLPDIRWHVETNGTIAPTRTLIDAVEHWSVSPKLSNNEADPAKRRLHRSALAVLRDDTDATFKFVATSPGDVDEAADVAAEHGLPTDRVWIMPEGVTAETVVATHADIIDRVIAHRFHTTTRLHVLLWGDRRGV